MNKSRKICQEDSALDTNDTRWYRRLIEEIRSHKIWKVFLLLSLAALLLFRLGAVDWETSSYPVVGKLPFNALGEEILKMLFLVFLFEVYLRRESELAIHSLLFSKKVVTEMLDLRQVREVMSACFARIVPDEKFAVDMVRIVQNKAVLPSRHHHDVEYDVTITPLTGATDPLRSMFFAVHLIVRYESTVDTRQLRFILAHSNHVYNDFRDDPTAVWKWLQVVPEDLADYADKVMRVRSCRIDGLSLEEFPAQGVPGCVQQFAVPDEFRNGQRHRHHFELTVMVRRNGHLMTINLDYPTRNMRITVDYAQTDIAYLNVVDSLTSARAPEIRYAPDDSTPGTSHRVTVQLRDDWILPKSTAAFVWRLRSE